MKDEVSESEKRAVGIRTALNTLLEEKLKDPESWPKLAEYATSFVKDSMCRPFDSALNSDLYVRRVIEVIPEDRAPELHARYKEWMDVQYPEALREPPKQENFSNWLHDDLAKLPMKIVDADGKDAFPHVFNQYPKLIIRADGPFVCVLLDGEPMGMLQSIEFKATLDGEPKAKVRLINYSEQTQRRVELMRKIPWLEVEEIPESEWSKGP